jgi:putative peptidoglycan lipid II flippase
MFSMLVLALAGVFVAGASGQMSASSFIAHGDTRTPTAVGVVVFTLAVPLKALLFWRFGIVGLAAAASIGTLVTAAVHQFLLAGRVQRLAEGAAST